MGYKLMLSKSEKGDLQAKISIGEVSEHYRQTKCTNLWPVHISHKGHAFVHRNGGRMTVHRKCIHN